MRIRMNELFKLFNQFVQSTPQIAKATAQYTETAQPATADCGLPVKRSKSRRTQSVNSPFSAKALESADEKVLDFGSSTTTDEPVQSKPAPDVSWNCIYADENKL